MISREEFDAEMAERDRRARLRAVAWDEAIGALDDRMERLATADRENVEAMQRSDAKWEQRFAAQDARMARLDKTMARLDKTMAKFGETLTAQGGAYALLWADYLRHKNEHDGSPA